MALTTNTIPSVWSKLLIESLQKNLVYKRLFNDHYQIDVKDGGNKVIIPSIGAVTINDYTRYQDITYEQVADSSTELPLDQEKYFAVLIDDLDAMQSTPDIMAGYIREARYQLQKHIDSYLAGQLGAAAGTITANMGTSSTPLEINSSNVGETLIKMARLMDDADVPRNNRVIVVPSFVAEDLVLSNIIQSTDNVDELANGKVGRYAGMDILMSTNVPNTAGAKYEIYAGSDIGATAAIQVNKTEVIGKMESKFASAVRGLTNYGSVVTRPGTIVKAFFNEAAEA